MTLNRQAVADAINDRMEELGVTPKHLAERSGLSEAVLRDLRRNYRPERRPQRSTLVLLSEALRWPANYLGDLLDDQISPTPPPTDVLVELRTMRQDLDALRARVDEIEQAQRRTGTA